MYCNGALAITSLPLGLIEVDSSGHGRKPQVQFFRAHSQSATGLGTSGLDTGTHH